MAINTTQAALNPAIRPMLDVVLAGPEVGGAIEEAAGEGTAGDGAEVGGTLVTPAAVTCGFRSNKTPKTVK